ncbi:MAG TPA: hemolysin family protein [Spirochaetota bacterium]|nr:hemolysin family protein [Spirochaetota bacterium]HPS88127.1 hemolysin family protein [Spirochaetota bacterium]
MEVLIIAALILLNSFFALSEIALISSNNARLEQKSSRGNKGAEFALKLLEKPENFLSAIQIGITVVGIISGAYGGIRFSDDLTKFFLSHNIFIQHAGIISLTIVISTITYFSIVIGELVPKTFALNNSETIAVIVAPVIFLITKITYPVVAFLSISTNFLLKMMFVQTKKKSSLTEEELRMMVKVAKKEGVITGKEAEIHQNLFRFFDRKAEQIMTRRNEITWIDINDKNDIIEKTIMESPHSKFPVCSNDLENTLGIITVKDYIDNSKKKNFSLKSILRPVIFISEASEPLKILDKFKKEKCHFAMVLDEYGSVQGIITLHDLSENIFGNLPDIDEQFDPQIVKRSDNSYLIDGETQIDLLSEMFDIPDFKHRDDSYSTIAGYILHKKGRIAHTGDSFKADGYRIEVVDVDGLKIDKVLISKIINRKK